MGLEARLPMHAWLHLSPWRSSAGYHNLDLRAKQADQIFHPIMFVLQSLPLPTVIPAGPRELFFLFSSYLVKHLLEDISRKAVSVRRWGSKEEQSVMLSSLQCLVLFCYARPVFWSFLFFCLRITPCTAVCSEGSGLLAKTPQLTSDLCCENLTQMTTR